MKSIRQIALLLSISLALVGCCKDNSDQIPDRYDNVVVLYSAGYNDLTNYLRDNINILKKSALPMKSAKKALIVVAHNSVSKDEYITPVSPVVIQMSSDWSGNAILDTIKVLPASEHLLDKAVMSSVFSYICENFKSDHYGLVFSSHGTGWLPEGYYSKPLLAPEGNLPKTKTFGSTCEGTSAKPTAIHEMTIQDLAKAIPMHSDYIIFDACLMGGIETAYELKDITDRIGFSQAEVLAEGFAYDKLSECLLTNNSPEQFCKEYFNLYNSKSGKDKSATISFIDCSKLDAIATLCNRLFERYRSNIAAVNPGDVQGYFTSNKHWFYDLEDIMIKAGISDSDKAALSKAIDDCVIYKEATEKILGSIPIKTFCGFSSYLPCSGSPYLDNFYKTLAWNKATAFVSDIAE